MTPKKTISTSLSVPIADQSTGESSDGKVNLFIYRHNISSVTVGQVGGDRLSLKTTPHGSRAFYKADFDDVSVHETINFSGTSAELSHDPLSIHEINVITVEDPVTGAPMSSNVSVIFDATLNQLISNQAFSGEVDVHYTVRQRYIEYFPLTVNVQGGTGMRDATVSTFGKLYAYRYKELPAQRGDLECQKRYKKWKGNIEIPSFDPNNGEWIEVAKITSSYVAGPNSKGKRDAYEKPRGYPDTLEHPNTNYKIPDPKDEEDLLQERIHVTWCVNTVSGHTQRDSYIVQLAEPYRTNRGNFYPETKFTRTEPSEEKAKKAYAKIDWDSISRWVRDQPDIGDCKDLP